MSGHRLRECGLKVTTPRLKILEILELAGARHQHLSVEELHHRLAEEDVGLATVYRVLTQFEDVGLVRKHNFEGHCSVYELCQGGHHDHLVCVQCGGITEFTDPTIESRQLEIAAQYGFRMSDHALNIFGTCARCKASP